MPGRQKPNHWLKLLFLAILCLAAGDVALAAPTMTQTFDLHPGWNAIFLEVQPADTRPTVVFNNPAIESVWSWLDRDAPVIFVKNPQENFESQPGWYGARLNDPTSPPYLNNLHAIIPNQPYMVKIKGTQPLTLNVTGSPAPFGVIWVPDSFNLVGFPVHPSNPPSFDEFFGPSKAHAGQAIFHLSPLGAWELIAAPLATRMKRGEAFWIYSEGTSDFHGPLRVKPNFGQDFDFGKEVRGKALEFQNLSANSQNITVKLAPSADGTPLAPLMLGQPTQDAETTWQTFAEMSYVLNGGAHSKMLFQVDRAKLTVSQSAGILEVSGGGMQLLLPVMAENPVASMAGLWFGYATVDQVSQINKSAPDMFFDFEMVGTLAGLKLIDNNSEWSYLAPVAYPKGWEKLSYDASTWAKGKGALGFGIFEGETIATNIATPNPTTYFRTTFSLDEISIGRALKLNLTIDDGAAVFLNGVEIYRVNLPGAFEDPTARDPNAPVIGSAQLASGVIKRTTIDIDGNHVLTSVEPMKKEIELPGWLLRAGKNLLAIEVHQGEADPEDDSDLLLAADLVALASETEALVMPLVGQGSTWQVYQGDIFDPASGTYSPPPGWPTSVTGGWVEMQAPLGFGNSGNRSESSTLSFRPTHYFKRYFSTTAAQIGLLGSNNLQLRLMADDGAVVRLNGQPVFRTPNLSAGDLTPDDSATSAAPDGGQNYQITIPGSLLRADDGDELTLDDRNELTVEVHDYFTEIGDTAAVTPPTPTPAVMTMRVLLYIDPLGAVRLLKQAYLMQEKVTNADGGTGYREVLLIDDAKLPDYVGSSFRDGEVVGQRFSAPLFDFTGNAIPFAGTYPSAEPITGVIDLSPDVPTHPLLHRYHPDHSASSVPTLKRTISLTFADTYPPGAATGSQAPPGWGFDRIGGIYQESIDGIYKVPLSVAGSFELTRVSTAAVEE